MSQGTNLYTRIRYAGKTYNNKYEVEQDLESVRQRRDRALSDLLALAFMTEPQKFCGDESPEWYLKHRVAELTEEIEDCATEDYRLTKLLDEWEHCHIPESGLGIAPPTAMVHDSTFIDGDFVLTNIHPTRESLLQ